MSDARKVQVISKMKHHQGEYAKYADELKKITQEEEAAKRNQRQEERLERYKSKYNFFIKEDGTTQKIDWAEVESLVRSSFATGVGYMLGFDESGAEGLGCNSGTAPTFTVMIEEEGDARKYLELQARRKEFQARSKG